MASGAVTLTRAPVGVRDLVSIANGAPVAVADDARHLMAASRRVVTDAMEWGEQIYGVTAGLGHARDRAVPTERLRAMQADMVRMHAGALGPALPRKVVRAAMGARLIGITRGGSGASAAVADMLLALLNRDVVPVVPASGSVGAADLAHHAHIGLVAMGEGMADVSGRLVSGADALREAGLTPLVLEPKDGIAMISANGVTLGHGALVLDRAGQLLAIADGVAATSLDAIRGNPSVLSAAVHAAKGSPGQERSAARMRAQVSGSDRVARPASLQDPLSFRVVPQVHGACGDVLDTAVAALETELNARADNPLADVGSHEVISNGNFHPMLVALSFESVRVALAHVTQLSDRRLGQLWDAAIDNLLPAPPSDVATMPAWAAGLLMRYASAARATAARRLAGPVTLDVPPLDLGQEDHATNAPAAVAATDELLDVVADVVSVEALAAYARLCMEPEPMPGVGTARVVRRLDGLLADLGPGAPTADVQRRARGSLSSLYLDRSDEEQRAGLGEARAEDYGQK